MVEAHHELGQADLERHPLVVPPGLAERMRAVIALEVDGAAPRLHEAVHTRDGQNGTTLAAEEEVLVLVGLGGEERLHGLDTGLIERDAADLPGLPLPDLDLVHGLEVAHLAGTNVEEVARAEVRVDPEREERQVPGLMLEEPADGCDVLRGADRLDLDAGALGGVVGAWWTSIERC